ncbi:MAG: flagellar motor protein MotB [Planctomycetota bacterium]
MSKKCKCPPTGAPEWMTTYGDMMTLLLCFFVLIVSFSEIKKDEQFQAVVEHIKEAFGMMGGGGKIPITDDPALSLIERLDALRLKQEKVPNRSNTKDPGQEGREPQVTKVREGLMITTGGRITFEPASARLSEESKESLRQLAEVFKGWENLVELRGHAASLELPEGGTASRSSSGSGEGYTDLWHLSHARAKAVFDYLTVELEIDPDRFRLTANADREPLDARAADTDDAEVNRRVEVLVSESLKQDFTQPETGSRS